MEGSARRVDENRRGLMLVCPNSSGIGLPYAPENWPNQGDTWGWKVGKRFSSEGHFLDRYLVLPASFLGIKNSTGKDLLLRSKTQVERYITTNFPDADLDAFFSSFHWKIPVQMAASSNDMPMEAQRPDISSDAQGTKMNILYISSDLQADVENLATEVDQVLQGLREAHEEQYKLVEEALTAQKNRVISLYEQLGREKEALAEQTSGTFNFLSNSFMDVVDEIKNEVGRLRDMEETVKEVAKNKIDNLRKCFGEHLRD